MNEIDNFHLILSNAIDQTVALDKQFSNAFVIFFRNYSSAVCKQA